jgi:hypothetical protein
MMTVQKAAANPEEKARLQKTWEKLARESKVNNFAKKGGSAADLLRFEELTAARIKELESKYGKALDTFKDPENKKLALQIAHLKDESMAGRSLVEQQAEIDKTFTKIVNEIRNDPKCIGVTI